MKKSNSNYRRLTVYLINTEKKKDFKTTYTYRDTQNSTPIRSVSEAIAAVRALHSDGYENATELAKKIKKVEYSGKKIELFSILHNETDNGWLVK